MRRGLAASTDDARRAVADGRVLVSGSIAAKPERMVDPSEPIELRGDAPRFVSRGGEKLDAALDRFSIDVTGWRCADVGSSTGGFTDCLLQRGAASVIAIDVGRGQLDWGLRNDARVTVRERTDVRDVDPDEIGPVDLIVGDLSFISLRSVLPALAAIAGDAPLLVLVKPQFEVARKDVPAGGVVRDQELRDGAVANVVASADALGLGSSGAFPSPVPGAEGNQEIFVLLRRKRS